MVEDLINDECIENKSLMIKFPSFNIVPEALINHFIRGFYDGDGMYIHTNHRKGFIGTFDMLNGIKNVLKKCTNIKGKMNIIKSKNIYYLRFGTSDTKILDSYLYDNCTICLERKK